MKTVSIYTTPTCHFCHLVKDYLTEKNIPFQSFDVIADMEKRKEMLEKSHQMGVPVVIIGEDVIVGFDKAKIDAALGL